jgi:hypothetical protein
VHTYEKLLGLYETAATAIRGLTGVINQAIVRILFSATFVRIIIFILKKNILLKKKDIMMPCFFKLLLLISHSQDNFTCLFLRVKSYNPILTHFYILDQLETLLSFVVLIIHYFKSMCSFLLMHSNEKEFYIEILNYLILLFWWVLATGLKTTICLETSGLQNSQNDLNHKTYYPKGNTFK